MELLDIDELQAKAILDMQLRRLAALERQKIKDQHAELEAMIAEYNSILASEERQREIISNELAEIVAKYGDDRRTKIMLGFDGDMSIEDLIPEEEMVVTITRGGYVKRTRSDNYRSQQRGGKGVKGAQLRGDDVVEHFFVTTTHHWLLFFTNLGRVYRAKAYELEEAGRDAKGQHVANLLAFQPDEQIAQVLDLRDYQHAPYLVLATSAAWSRRPAWRTTTRTAPAASSPSTCARATSLSRPCWCPKPMTCCWSPARASRSASPPPTRHCARWAGPPPASPA